MEITFLGHACFKIIAKDLVLITDPPAESTGIKLGKNSADILTISHHHYDHDAAELISGDPTTLDAPGEYEVKGVMIQGVPSYHDDEKGAKRGFNTIFTMNIEGIKIAHLGDLGCELDDEQISELGDVDVLLIPVGGIYTIDAKGAANVVSQVEPKVVIPMHYYETNFSTKSGDKLDEVEKFLKEMGVSDVKKETKIKLTRSTLPVDESQVIVLEQIS